MILGAHIRATVNPTTFAAAISVFTALLASKGIALLSQTVRARKCVAAVIADMAVTAMGSLVMPTAIVVSLILTVVMALVNITTAMTPRFSLVQYLDHLSCFSCSLCVFPLLVVVEEHLIVAG